MLGVCLYTLVVSISRVVLLLVYCVRGLSLYSCSKRLKSGLVYCVRGLSLLSCRKRLKSGLVAGLLC